MQKNLRESDTDHVVYFRIARAQGGVDCRVLGSAVACEARRYESHDLKMPPITTPVLGNNSLWLQPSNLTDKGLPAIPILHSIDARQTTGNARLLKHDQGTNMKMDSEVQLRW